MKKEEEWANILPKNNNKMHAVNSPSSYQGSRHGGDNGGLDTECVHV
jgi:hypothetical protein